MDRFRLPFLTALAAVMVCHIRCLADSPQGEYRVKAAFAYNFTQFVEWPAGTFPADDSPFVVAIVGDDPFKGALEELMNDKHVGSRLIVVNHFSSVEQIGQCQLLYIPAGENSEIDAIIRKLGNRPVLTVGETDVMMAAGGGIRLLLVEGRMRFQISPDVLAAVGLKPSAKLMKLARIYSR
jgi:YfiR/HmsC-like